MITAFKKLLSEVLDDLARPLHELCAGSREARIDCLKEVLGAGLQDASSFRGG
ncbi:hypothetical protein PMN64_39545 [Bradyrhizobium sp. UFLA01-814]|uniref:hypothetical protein n=1 Tax=Bradyrhizobium sp. UFLA01-814 TaxID=3023480 RepID=UPI00398A8645